MVVGLGGSLVTVGLGGSLVGVGFGGTLVVLGLGGGERVGFGGTLVDEGGGGGGSFLVLEGLGGGDRVTVGFGGPGGRVGGGGRVGIGPVGRGRTVRVATTSTSSPSAGLATGAPITDWRAAAAARRVTKKRVMLEGFRLR